MLRTAILTDAQLMLVVVYVEGYSVLFTMIDFGVDIGNFQRLEPTRAVSRECGGQ